MTRLPRSRKGKTPLDVTVTIQDGLKRVRITMGDDNFNKKNSDLDEQETEDLITMLTFKLAELREEL